MKVHSKINIPVALAEDGGSLQGFVWNNMVRGGQLTFGEDFVTINGLNPNEQPAFADLVAIVQGGGSFEGIRLGLQFTALAAGRDVPVGVPASDTTPEGEETRQKTWLEWIKDNSQTLYKRVNGTPVYYIMKSALNSDLLTSEQIQAAITTSGVNVIEHADGVARIQSGDYEPFEL